MITLENCSFSYSSKKQVFRDLNLSLEAGRIYGLLGKNAAGKSTLLRLMSGLLFPTKGRCEVSGFNSAKRQPGFLANVFLIPEDTWFPKMTIKKYVDIEAPFYPNFNRDQFFTWLKEFQVPTDERLDQLSFGQKKKTLIAFGLAANTKIVLMDEPTNGLDIPSKAEFRRIVASAFDETRTLIVSTHQVRDLDSLIDGVIVVDGGEILLDATLDKVAEQLVFGNEPTIDEATDSDILYTEKNLFGHAVVRENRSKKHTRVDLEMLFQAAIGNPKRVKKLFEMR